MKKIILVITFFLLSFGIFSFNAPLAHADILYFNGAVDNDWNTLGNWWISSNFNPGDEALALPIITDDVIISASVNSNGGPAASVNTMTVNGSANIRIAVTVAAGATFNGSSQNFIGGNIIGGVQFNDNSRNNNATVTGNAIFLNSSSNIFATVTGTADFSGDSFNGSDGIVSGQATFSDNSYNVSDELIGNIIFNNFSYNANSAVITGDAEFNDSSYNLGTITGDATFTYVSGAVMTLTGTQGWGTVMGDAKGVDDVVFTEFNFNDNSVNYGTFSANDVNFNDDSYNNVNGVITSTVIFNNSSYNAGTINGDATFTYASGGAINLVDYQKWGTVTGVARGVDVVALSDFTFNNDAQNVGTLTGDAIFYDSSINSGTVDGNASFYDLTDNNGTITGNAFFYDFSDNNATVDGDACFHPTADNNGTVNGSTTVCPISAPVVVTSSASNITLTAVDLNGEVTSVGGENPPERGFEYGLTDDYGLTVTQSDGPYGADPFTISNVSGLTCDTEYHFRAYAINSGGTGYGDDEIFSTSVCPLTLYWYNDGVDADWGTLTDNWWTDEDHTLQADDVPSSLDTVITLGTVGPSVDLDTWGEPDSIDASATGITFSSADSESVSINITGDAIFNGSAINAGTVTGDVTFNDESSNQGEVVGDVEFNDLSYNGGDIIGDVIFRDSSYNASDIEGDATFEYASGGLITLFDGQQWGTITGDSLGVDGIFLTQFIFNDDSSNSGVVRGNATFNDDSYNEGDITGVPSLVTSPAVVVNKSTALLNAEIINTGNTIFNDVSYSEEGAISINVTFNDESGSYSDTISGDACFNDDSENDGSTIGGDEICPVSTENVTARGFNYGLTTSYGSTVTENAGPYSTGVFSATLTGLSCGTTYHFRSYATNDSGTSYGSDRTFETSPCPSSGSSPSRPRQIPPAETICPVGHLFSATTGRPCTKYQGNNNSTEPTPPNTCVIINTLRLGSKGAEVMCLQNILKILADGMFGPQTKTSVVSFQGLNGLVPDGVVGPKTRTVLLGQ